MISDRISLSFELACCKAHMRRKSICWVWGLASSNSRQRARLSGESGESKWSNVIWRIASLPVWFLCDDRVASERPIKERFEVSFRCTLMRVSKKVPSGWRGYSARSWFTNFRPSLAFPVSVSNSAIVRIFSGFSNQSASFFRSSACWKAILPAMLLVFESISSLCRVRFARSSRIALS